MTKSVNTSSPNWNSSTKMVIGLTFVAVLTGFLIQSQQMLSPLLISFMLVYLLYPVAIFMNRNMRLPWGLSVTLLYLVLVIALLAGVTLSGVGIIQQGQTLVNVVQKNLSQLPQLIEQASHMQLQIGPITLNTEQLDLQAVLSQLVSSIEPLLGKTGELLSTLAGGAFNTLGWTLFVLVVSYFLLAESNGLPKGIMQFSLPGYSDDLNRMGKELGQIWNAFFRGQLIVVGLAILIYSVVLGSLGVNYAMGMALMAGGARFLPYVGPAVSWTILALVAYFQDYKLFGLSPFIYTLVVLVFAWVIDMILDYIVMPRIMADALKVHPAAVMVAALVAANLFGFVGIIMAAPMLATVQLIGRYIFHKMFDLPPWDGLQEEPSPPPLRKQLADFLQMVKQKIHLVTRQK